MSQHITVETLERLEAGTLSLGDVAALGRHLRECARCRDDVEELGILPQRVAGLQRELREEVHMPQHTWRRSAIAAAAVVVIAVAVAAFFLTRPRTRPDEPSPHAGALRPAVGVQDPVQPRPAVKDYGRDDWNAWVRTAVAERRLAMPAVVAELQPPPVAFRGEQAAARRAGVVYPYGAVVREPRPTFEWSAPAGAESVVQIYDARDLVAASAPIRAERWTSPVPLRPGETYTWQVEVRQGDATSILPAPPAPPALFRILDADARRTIAAAEERFPDDPLLLAVVYARFGLEREALAAMERHTAEARTPVAEAMLRSIRAWR